MDADLECDGIVYEDPEDPVIVEREHLDYAQHRHEDMVLGRLDSFMEELGGDDDASSVWSEEQYVTADEDEPDWAEDREVKVGEARVYEGGESSLSADRQASRFKEPFHVETVPMELDEESRKAFQKKNVYWQLKALLGCATDGLPTVVKVIPLTAEEEEERRQASRAAKQAAREADTNMYRAANKVNHILFDVLKDATTQPHPAVYALEELIAQTTARDDEMDYLLGLLCHAVVYESCPTSYILDLAWEHFLDALEHPIRYALHILLDMATDKNLMLDEIIGALIRDAEFEAEPVDYIISCIIDAMERRADIIDNTIPLTDEEKKEKQDALDNKTPRYSTACVQAWELLKSEKLLAERLADLKKAFDVEEKKVLTFQKQDVMRVVRKAQEKANKREDCGRTRSKGEVIGRSLLETHEDLHAKLALLRRDFNKMSSELEYQQVAYAPKWNYKRPVGAPSNAWYNIGVVNAASPIFNKGKARYTPLYRREGRWNKPPPYVSAYGKGLMQQLYDSSFDTKLAAAKHSRLRDPYNKSSIAYQEWPGCKPSFRDPTRLYEVRE